MSTGADAGAVYPRLVADIGGTNARFALVREPGHEVQAVRDYRCAQFPSLWDAMARYLDEHVDHGGAPRACAIGIATAVTGDEVRMTNHPWSFSIADLRRRLGVERLLVINDFTALALSLPALPDHARRQVGGGVPVAGAPLALLGPGTGLGVSGLLPGPGGMLPISGEGGHVTLGSLDPFECAVLADLAERFGHVSAERALSGPGLENLYRAVCRVQGLPVRELDAPAISAAALEQGDTASVQALAMFCGLLGSVAGNLALTLGARGGVYVGGGIVQRWGAAFDHSPFRARFEAKGRFSGYLAAIPTWVVTADTSPALLGAARALDVLH